jgi:alanine racemase
VNYPTTDCHCIIPARPTWLEIKRNALIQNIDQIRRQIGPHPQLMAVIKANAYGHGAVEVATICQEAGADYFGVATLNEALELRQHGIHSAILVLGYTPVWLAETLVKAQIAATVYDLETAHALAAAAHQAQRRAVVHVKVNTGMNRLGLPLEEVADFVRALHNFPTIKVEGIFTHFAEADQPEQDFAQVQLARFSAVLATLENAGLRPPLVHAANSAATLTLPAAHFDMVRCGIALYGLDPDPGAAPLPAGFQPVLSWKAHVAQVRALTTNEGIGYGRAFVTQRPTITAIGVAF